ncbi:MAG: hypothetical protein JNM32_07230 [Dechloromonas sp.]|nr:hypothetical protein [Dechloromonas sp.]
MSIAFVLFCLVMAVLLIFVWRRAAAAQRAEYIRHFALPKGLYERLRSRRPDFGPKECQLVAQGLRQFFLAYLRGGRRFVSMPSQAVDDLWHEFILYTREYETFCRKAFGHFLHHTPAVVLSSAGEANAGLRRCWWHTCREENINPRQPTRLPLLFALDAKLGIADGFHYVPDCGSVRNRRDAGSGTPYCGGDFSSTYFDGGTEGFGDSGDSGGSGASVSGGESGGGSSESSGGDSGGGSSCGGGGCGGGGGGD